MYCKKCGKELNKDSKFCTNCGEKNISIYHNLESKIWFRLVKVMYIILYIISAGIVIGVFVDSQPYYSSYSKTYYGSYGEAFFYSLLSLLISLILLRIIKITFNYIVLGKKLDFKLEFKTFF